MRESCVLTRMSWFGIISKFMSPETWPLNLIFAVASFRLLDRAIPTRDIWPFRCWKKYQMSLRLLRRRLQVSVISVIYFNIVLTTIFWDVLTFWKWATWRPPVAFVMRFFHPGRHVYPFGRLGPRCRRTGEVHCWGRKKTKGHWFTWNLEMVNCKLGWRMLKWFLFFEDRTPVVVSWNCFGMMQHFIYWIVNPVPWEKILPLSYHRQSNEFNLPIAFCSEKGPTEI